jgi:hypothetical protein
MKLFKGHAVMPRIAHDPLHVVRTYLTIAETWQEARAAVARTEPGAEFVTIPAAMPDPLMIDVRSIGVRECEDLRAACAWNEERLRNGFR